MRNSSLIERFCADNLAGLKSITEAMDFSTEVFLNLKNCTGVVEERSILERRQTVRTAGRDRSEDAGISNEKTGEKPVRRKPKVSLGRLIRPG